MKATWGPTITADGVTFRLWAPAAKTVTLLLDGKSLPMTADDGVHVATIAGARAGARYQFEIDGELRIPDPGSRFQPEDVHAASEVIHPHYDWVHPDWKGRPFAETVLYELHVGTFTPEGTYRAAIGRLDHLVETGVTAVELMPVADFPGRWNWGYDGVLLFAPDSAYGRPDDLKALIDAAHGKGLTVFLDVVYNHFGPDGNYLHAIAPQAFSQAQTPWGVAIDYGRPEMRALAIENALYWLREFRFDGLRLDAVHAIVAPGEPPLLEELSRAVGALARETGRHIHLVLENDDNGAAWLDPVARAPDGKYRAQWNDDYHHAWHVLLTGETNGYYKDYEEAGGRVARSLAEGFVYQGEPSRHRGGAPRGAPSAALSPLAFVDFLQNHDQIGNRARGERLTTLVDPQCLSAAHAILLLSPSPPLLFMGEEWGAREPFPFFCDFQGELADAVREGRRKEFAEAYAAFGNAVPDPMAESTVRSAKLDWSQRDQPPHRERLALTRALLRVRHAHVVPFAAAMTRGQGIARYEEGLLTAEWSNRTQVLELIANLSDAATPCPDRDADCSPGDLGRQPALDASALVGLLQLAGRVMPPAVPLATYRLQLTKEFGFDDAAALVPYLRELGISHLYASPFLAARPGSTHGYDIVDHNRLNPELGGEAAFDRLSQALAAADMGLILDFVPNHMGVGFSDNAWWLDVLEWGQKSPFAASFDIDWTGLPHRAQPGVLLPILGKPYAEALADGEIALRYDEESGEFAAWYFEHKLPINPQRYGEILRTLVSAANAHDIEAGQAIITLAQRCRDPRSPSYAEAPELKRDLAAIAGAGGVIERGLFAYRAATDAGRLTLHRLLERQNYHVASWRVAFSAINYRRFFDINDLAGLRAEHPATFRAMHGLVARLIAEGRLHGLRLDHVDGLRDPAQYARRLQEMIRRIGRARRGSFYVVIEKILGKGERLPKFAGVAGTTGYERLNHISHALLDPAGLPALEETWRDFTGERASFDAMLVEAKRMVLDSMLASEFTVLSRALARIAAGSFATRDFTLNRLTAALQAYVIEFPVYRTYIAIGAPSESDRRLIADVVARARAKWIGPDPEIFDFLHDAISLALLEKTGYSATRVRNFALKLQQFTGPLMAKSLEDTAFYRYHRLLALNEVGGEPAEPATSLEAFHAAIVELARTAPHGMTATATHDTKRGEDARMRILALSELAPAWREHVREWRELNKRHAQAGAPTPAHEYMFYQSLVGAWPARGVDTHFADRIAQYAVKAMREGKQQTSWTNPNQDYEERVLAFLRAVLGDGNSEFLQSISAFAARAALLGACSSLSQLALKTLLPGVPDFYQGTELWDDSLVDPDNRRPVDYVARQACAGASVSWPELATSWRDGRVKLVLMRALLRIRNAHADIFRDGAYEPLGLEGAGDHVIAFRRGAARKQVVVLVGRHFAPLTDGGRHWPRGWRGAAPFGRAHDLIRDRAIAGDDLALSKLFAEIPVAVLRPA